MEATRSASSLGCSVCILRAYSNVRVGGSLWVHRGQRSYLNIPHGSVSDVRLGRRRVYRSTGVSASFSSGTYMPGDCFASALSVFIEMSPLQMDQIHSDTQNHVRLQRRIEPHILTHILFLTLAVTFLSNCFPESPFCLLIYHSHHLLLIPN